MKAALLAVGLASCSHAARVAECDELVGLVDHLATCPTLPEPARSKIAAVRVKLDDMLVGLDKAPQAEQDNLRKTCRSQHDSVALAYAQFAPDCLK